LNGSNQENAFVNRMKINPPVLQRAARRAWQSCEMRMLWFARFEGIEILGADGP
jgi:hypothetical protein